MARHTITVGVDGSRGSEEALAWAVSEATLSGAVLRVAHAWQPQAWPPVPIAPSEEDTRETATRLLDAAVRTIRPEVAYEAHVVRGAAGHVLVELSSDSDLLVVGARGRGGFVGLLLGSVSRYCIARASCPVAVVRPSEGPSEGRIVVGVDGSPESRSALRWACEEARRRHAVLEAVTAWQPPWTGPHHNLDVVSHLARARAAEALEDAVTAVVPPAMPVNKAVVEGPVARVLLSKAIGASALVLGSRGLSDLAAVAFGSVSKSCAHRAPCPVVIIPWERPVEEGWNRDRAWKDRSESSSGAGG